MDKENKRIESELYSKALALASEKHAGQIRKEGTPYILHPIKVSRMIADAGYDIEYQIAGLFHDLLEDTNTTEEEIEKFGRNILEATKLVSKNYCENKNKYIDNILNNHIAAVVKNADRIDNLNDACYSNDEKFQKRYLENSKEKYKGKFSEALDLAIEKLQIKMSINNLKEKGNDLSEYMELYSDKEKRLNIEREKRINELLNDYKDCEKPDKCNPNLRYYEVCGMLFCAYITEKHPFTSKEWLLTEIGWIPQDTKLFIDFEDDVNRVTREYVLSEFFTRKNNNEILDFISADEI